MENPQQSSTDSPLATSERPKTIPIEIFKQHQTAKTTPIIGLNTASIPNITVPEHLSIKKSDSQSAMILSVRQLFTGVTAETVFDVAEKLRHTIISHVKSEEMVAMVSKEILECFVSITGEKYVKIFIHLLNAVHKTAYNDMAKNNQPTQTTATTATTATTTTTTTTTTSTTSTTTTTSTDREPEPNRAPIPLRRFFLNGCKDMIFKFVSKENIQRLAEFDTDNTDQRDQLNKERERIDNLILTLCYLYDQRSLDIDYIKISARNLYPLLEQMMNNYLEIHQEMEKLGDPYGDIGCTDEDRYELIRKMGIIYAELLLLFIEKECYSFMTDETEIAYAITDNVNSKKMAQLMTIFRDKIVSTPTFTNGHLAWKANEIFKNFP